MGQFTSQAKILLARHFFTRETMPTQVCAVAVNKPIYHDVTEDIKYNTMCSFYRCLEHCRPCGILFDKAAIFGVSIKERSCIIPSLELLAVKI
jgi:hypothetical protein